MTLSYDYGAATVWLEALSPEAHPMTHDLCTRHAERTGAPRGWHLVVRPVPSPVDSLLAS